MSHKKDCATQDMDPCSCRCCPVCLGQCTCGLRHDFFWTRFVTREKKIRSRIASAIETRRTGRGVTIRELARKMGTSPSQVQRVRGAARGSLTLSTICRAAEALDMIVTVEVRPKS